MDKFATVLEENKNNIEDYLNTILPKSLDKTSQAMRYAVMNGGKRLRPNLTYITGSIFNTPLHKLNTPAAGVELIHCYSLIHDDLPAMDDDDLRRGKPACHKKFSEATAILAGDALQTIAFEILSNNELNPIPDTHKLKMIRYLARASGINGMIYGQTLDIASENKKISLEQLNNLHLNKTGKLIAASVHLGILASECSDYKIIEPLIKFAEQIGVLFQIQDDILDVSATSEVTGKPTGSDLSQNKATYVSILGLDDAKQQASSTLKNALGYLDTLKNSSKLHNISLLEHMAKYFFARSF